MLSVSTPSLVMSSSPDPDSSTADASPAVISNGEEVNAPSTDAPDDDDDMAVDSDVDEDTLMDSKPSKPSPPPSSSSPSSLTPLERLNLLLQQTEQFASYVKSQPNASPTPKEPTKRSHLDQKEKEEDALLIEDELVTSPSSSFTRLLTQPSSIAGEMRDYQLEALNWLIRLHEQKINGILADEMGLGKTLMSLSLLSYLKETGYTGPHLIIVPKSTSSNWVREVGRWTPTLSVMKFHGNQQEREEQKKRLGQCDITVTTYEMVIREKSALKKVRWKYLYIDEAHRIKNEHSLLSTVVRTIPTEHRLLITGTPLQNSLHELWALLNFLVPSMFDQASDFEQWFDLTGEGGEGEKMTMVSRLHRILRPFLLRRLKSDVESTLLPKVETNLYVGLSAMQRQWYAKVLSREVEVLNSSSKGKAGKMRLLNIVMQLRKCCNHPYLFQGAEPGPPYVEGEHMIENAGKMVLLDRLLKRLFSNGNRVLIFSQMTRLLDILEDYMRYRGYEYSRIDGQTKQEERDDAMDAYNAPHSSKFAFLLSTRAGGLGINLQTADTVILYDSDWNPQMDLQAQDRAHRIGQKKQVRVFRFVTEDSIEQKIVERAMKKLFLDALVIKQGRLSDAEKGLGADELQEMVRFGASRIFSSGESTITDADIDVILQEGAEKTEAEREKLKEVAGVSGGEGLLNFSLGGPEKNLMEFEGKDYSGYRAKGKGLEFINLPQRERKENYSENKYFRDALYGEKKDKGQVKREWKPAQRLDFQFFDERLEELERKEWEGEQRYREMKAKRAEEKKERKRQEEFERRERVKEERRIRKLEKLREKGEANGDGVKEEGVKAEDMSDEEADDTSRASPSPSPSIDESKAKGKGKKGKEEEVEEEEDEGVDDDALRTEAGCLTEEEAAEKEELEGQGFGDWQRKHFNGYIRAVERYGRDAEKEIAESGLVEGKTVKEVRLYHRAFMERYESIKDWEKLMERIEKGEAKRDKLNAIQLVIDNKVKRHRRPLDTLTLSYPTAQKLYTAEEDRFLLCSLSKVGYGAWDEIKGEVRRSWMFRFDWFLKSRTASELQKRADYIVKLIEKENEEIKAEQARKRKGNTPAKGAKATPVKGKAAVTGKRKAEAAPAAKSHKKKR